MIKNKWTEKWIVHNLQFGLSNVRNIYGLITTVKHIQLTHYQPVYLYKTDRLKSQ